ncbi:MAG: Histidine kinase, partial [Pseudonocardia sp.]|nr:Histidine kinase [Pseudonocardia sp.]
MTTPSARGSANVRGDDAIGLPRFTGFLRPLVDRAARVRATVHTKLLAGFLAGALLLVAMAVLSFLVINRMGTRVDQLSQLQDKMDRARQMEYAITAQSHYRAMALLTRDDSNNQKIATAKRNFTDNLTAVEQLSAADQQPFFDKVRAIDTRYDAASAQTLTLYQAGDIPAAMNLHLTQEHPISHELEAAMRDLEAATGRDMAAARAAIDSDESLLTWTVAIF